MTGRRRTRRGERGQSLIELGFVCPLLVLFLLGVAEMGYSLYQAHLATALAREASNLIARHATLDEAERVLRKVAARPMSFDDGVVILSVLRLGTSGTNDGVPIIAQRLRFGKHPASSMLGDPGAALYRADPDHHARNPASDANIRATLPNGLELGAGQSVYVTEVYQPRRSFVHRGMFGRVLPDTIGASAFF